MMPNWPKKNYLLIILLLIIATGVAEWWMGRIPFCKCGIISWWSGDIWSNQNSQQFADPYTFTHILHGTIFYLLLWLAFGKKFSPWVRLVLAVLIEGGWEVFEHSDFIINRYREVTISLDYYGDSIFNSLADILAMVLGFILAWKWPVKAVVIGSIVLDLFLLWWIKDSLAVNIIMLIYPIEAVKNWQLGK